MQFISWLRAFTVSQELVLITVVVIAAILACVAIYAKQSQAQAYEAIPSILTPAEQRFYTVLSQAVQGRALIMTKVRVADIVKVRRSMGRRSFWRHFSQISQKHIDFVLVHPRSFDTLCLIELDDRSHARPSRMKRDRFINQVMQDTGLVLHRVKVRRNYDRRALLEQLQSCLV